MKLQVIEQRRLWWGISVGFILAGVVAMILSWQQLGTPLRLGLDFTGGTRLQLGLDCTQPGNCDRPLDLAIARRVVAEQGLDNNAMQVVDSFSLSVRSKSLSVEQRKNLESALSQALGPFDPQKTQIDTVGPTLGRQLFISGLTALLVSFGGIVLYLNFRFQLDYAVFAIVALLHDVLVTVGAFAILGLTQGVEIDSLFLVALLTIVGFSVNDTVVIYDRIRETIQNQPGQHIDNIVDDAVNQTLGRSINTSATTLLPLVGIVLFGGDTLKLFAMALIIGFVAGAYSSIFVASTLLAAWRTARGQEIAPVVETASTELDEV